MIIIKKYANRKIYGEIDGKKGYLTYSDISDLVRQGKEFQVLVYNRGTPSHGQDITAAVLKECLTRLVMPDTMVKELIQRYRNED